MNEVIKIPGRTSNRFLSWHSVIEKRGAYMATNANHAGRYYQMVHGIGLDSFLERTWYDQECIDYLINNYVRRDSEDEIIEEHINKYNLEWTKSEKNTFVCENFKIDCDHMNYKVIETSHLFGSVSLIQTYKSENMEDSFQFILNSILQKRKNETLSA